MPTSTKRSSPSASSSSRTSANESSRLPAASSSDTPCFLRLAAAFFGSNSTCMTHHTYGICMLQLPAVAVAVALGADGGGGGTAYGAVPGMVLATHLLTWNGQVRMRYP